jgi:hypothetical protein
MPIAGQQNAPIDVDEADMSGTSGRSVGKRPAEDAAETARPAKKRITRSCDQCKDTQYRCSGFLPCQICTMKGKKCSYNPYTRRGGRLRTPPPPPTDVEDPEKVRLTAKSREEQAKIKRFRSWDSLACDACRVLKIERCSGKIPCEHCFEKRIDCTYRLGVSLSHHISRHGIQHTQPT